MKRVFISHTRPANPWIVHGLTRPFKVTGLAIQKLLVRATTSHMSNGTCFIVASISIVPISLVSRHRISYTLGYQLLDGIRTHSLCREDNVGVVGAGVDAGATIANVGAAGVGDLHLLQDGLTDGGDESYDGDGRRDLLWDGPECGGDGGGEDAGGGEGDGGGEVDGGGNGDGDVATH
ncbi:hypothetical protein Tco_1257321 [Tanacetum coccineum]